QPQAANLRANILVYAASLGTLNHAPVPTAQNVTALEDIPQPITLAGTDADNDTLTFKITALPAHGTLYVGSGTAGHQITAVELPYTLSGNVVTYKGAQNYSGSDNFTFKANDGKVDSSSTATVSITVNAVNDAPSG